FSRSSCPCSRFMPPGAAWVSMHCCAGTFLQCGMDPACSASCSILRADEKPTANMQSVKEKVALSSIAVSAGLTAAKAVVGLATGSLAIVSEAAHSLLDLAATVMTYFAVRIADKPADAGHHYGHGKVESVSALIETALLFLLSGIVIWEALQRL